MRILHARTYLMMIIWLFSLLIGTHLINIFLQINSLTYFTGVMAILSILLAFTKTNLLYRVIGVFFLLSGIVVFIVQGNSMALLPYKMTSTLDLLSLIFVLPFITSIIKIGKYEHNVSKLLKTNVSNLSQIYHRSSISSFLLTSFLNLGTLPILHSILVKNLRGVRETIRNKLISQATLRAYAICVIWSPMEIIVAMTVDVTNISYMTYLPWLLLLSAFLFFIEWVLGTRYKAMTFNGTHLVEQKLPITAYKSIANMLLALILLIISVSFVNHYFQLGFIISVTLMIIPFSLVWAIAIGRIRKYFRYSFLNWKEKTSNLQNFFFLFLSVGFFITMLKETSILLYLQQPFYIVSDHPLIIFMLIQIIFLLLAMVGFHPLVTFSLLVEILNPLFSIISPMSIGIVLMMSSFSTIMAGPFNITVSITGAMLNINPYKVSLYNLGFALLFSSIGTMIALLLL